MKISLNWLKDYISTAHTPEKIADILTQTGLEVEKVEKIEAVQGGLEGVVIGEVIDCQQHPDADRLKVTRVDVGTGELLNIVCGAPNVAKGQRVVVATVGTTLYPKPDEPFKIKLSKIRGVESQGMLCAEDELGIGQSHDGILVLPEDTKVGISAAQYFDLASDYVFEIGLTPNRADAMGHIGVARDLNAYLKVHEDSSELEYPSCKEPTAEEESDFVHIQVESPKDSPFYSGLVLRNLTVQASPEWLQKRLRTVGIQPINNIVDCTNYAMMEYGNPLHAFDVSVLKGNIVVRKAKSGEKMVTLDGVERSLFAEDVVISNGKDPLCLAGVFGGKHSGVSENTTSIFLESAYFEPVSTRKMAKRHGLNTDASFRFERGVNPHTILCALHRCAQLIIDCARGAVAMNTRIVQYEIPQDKEIPFSPQRCRKLIGHDISAEKMQLILRELDIQLVAQTDQQWLLKVPAYRVDVTREADVVEEILRIYGFNAIPIPTQMRSSLPVFPVIDQEKWHLRLSEMLAGMGFSEILNNSLVSEKYSGLLGGNTEKQENDVVLLNPLSQELNTLRRNLLYPVLQTIAFNQNRQQDRLAVFEFGKTYHHYGDNYVENKRLILAISGWETKENWFEPATKTDFFHIKAKALAVIEKLGFAESVSFGSIENDLLEDGLEIKIFNNKAGMIGWPKANLLKHFGIKQTVYFADFDWDLLMELQSRNKVQFQELPKTFAMRRDFSLLLDEPITFQQLVDTAQKVDKKWLRSVDLFDVYVGDKLPAKKKSYAVSFHFQDNEKTLKDEQVDDLMTKIRQQYEQQFKAELR